MLANHYAAQGRKIIKLLKDLLPAEPVNQSTDATLRSSDTSLRSTSQPVNRSTKSEAIIARILVDVFGDADEKIKFTARMERIKIDANELGVRQSLSEAGLTGDVLDAKTDGLLHDRRILDAVRSDSVRICGQINDSTRQYLRRQLVEGMSGGETPLQLADRVQGVMQNSRDSALRISRNTVAQSLSLARREGRLAGGITHEVWLHSRGPGERRESHVAAEARYASDPKPIGDKFVVGGVTMACPRDPSAPAAETINCQCVVIGKRIKKAANDANNKNDDSSNSCNSWTDFVTYEQMLSRRGAAFDQAQAGKDKGNATDN